MALKWIKTVSKELPEDRELVLVKSDESDEPLPGFFDYTQGWTRIAEKRQDARYIPMPSMPVFYWARYNEEPVFFNVFENK
jgi:hypothetical protein